jgi:hypothetical protein
MSRVSHRDHRLGDDSPAVRPRLVKVTYVERLRVLRREAGLPVPRALPARPGCAAKLVQATAARPLLASPGPYLARGPRGDSRFHDNDTAYSRGTS